VVFAGTTDETTFDGFLKGHAIAEDLHRFAECLGCWSVSGNERSVRNAADTMKICWREYLSLRRHPSRHES
jgi:hypothetical protein